MVNMKIINLICLIVFAGIITLHTFISKDYLLGAIGISLNFWLFGINYNLEEKII